eukprot:6185334-Pleurochrysis_carterae.AAC.4
MSTKRSNRCVHIGKVRLSGRLGKAIAGVVAFQRTHHRNEDGEDRREHADGPAQTTARGVESGAKLSHGPEGY